jgi:hypothetical protein
MKRSFIIISLLTCTLVLSAQQPGPKGQGCSAMLKNSEVAYQSGLFNKCIETLEKTLDSCKLTRKNKEKALELLAKAYVETGEKEKAESTVHHLLKNFPHYELRESENPELFNRMVNKYDIYPKFTIGAKNTANWLHHKTTKVYSVLGSLDYSRPFNESGYFFTYYGYAEYEFVKDLSISIDGMFFYSGYTSSITKPPSFSLSYRESDDFMELPLYLKKYFHPAKNFLAYVSAGYGLFVNYRAKGFVSISYKKADIATTGLDADFDGELNNINMLPVNNRLTGQWNAGVGFGYMFKNLRFFADARYLNCTGTFTSPVKNDKIPELKNNFFFINNSIKLNQFEIGVTISYTFINSVKRVNRIK